jgi:hypothetical protein
MMSDSLPIDSSFAIFAGVALAIWFAAYAGVVITTRPRLDDAASGRDVWTDEPPAIAALLYPPNGKVPARAATATFLDLVARGVLRRERDQQGRTNVGVAAPPGPALRPYERMVYEHAAARARAAGDMVPEELLHLGSSDDAGTWMTSFVDQVVADARGRGLVADRASPSVRLRLQLTLLVLAGFILAATGSAQAALDIAVLYMMFGRLVLIPFRQLRRPTPTRTGCQLAAGYKVLRAQLANGVASGTGADDRMAAFAVALGVADDPKWSRLFAAQISGPVWSNISGTWRQVRVVRGSGSGEDPKVVLLFGFYLPPFFTVIFAVLLSLLPAGTPTVVSVAGWLMWACGSLLYWRWLYRGLYDLGHKTRAVVGQVIYLEVDRGDGATFYVALDDGRSDVAVKYEIDEKLFVKLRFGNWLQLDVTPKLGFLKKTEILHGPPERADRLARSPE